MAKRNLDAPIVAFEQQSLAGTYAPVLDAAVDAGNISGDIEGTDQGLLLGASGQGLADSGVTFTLARRQTPKPPYPGGFTRPLDDFLAPEIGTFTVAFPWVGSKRITTATPVDGDFAPLLAHTALLSGGLNLASAVWGAGVGHQFTPSGSEQPPFSAVVIGGGVRFKIIDCRLNSLSIIYTPGEIPIATADIAGRIHNPAKGDAVVAYALPTIDYGSQSDVSDPALESAGFLWGGRAEGFSTLTLTFTPTVDNAPDSNAVDGLVASIAGFETRIALTRYATASFDEWAYDQLYKETTSDLVNTSFDTAPAATGLDPALAIRVTGQRMQPDDIALDAISGKGAETMNWTFRGDAANSESEILYI